MKNLILLIAVTILIGSCDRFGGRKAQDDFEKENEAYVKDGYKKDSVLCDEYLAKSEKMKELLLANKDEIKKCDSAWLSAQEDKYVNMVTYDINKILKDSFSYNALQWIQTDESIRYLVQESVSEKSSYQYIKELIDENNKSQFVFIISPTYEAPVLSGGNGYTAGYILADVLIYDTKLNKILGRFDCYATNSESVKYKENNNAVMELQAKLEEDLRINFGINLQKAAKGESTLGDLMMLLK